MTPHLSPLALEEASSSLPLEADAQAHLTACAECSQKVSALKAENGRLLASPYSSATLNKLAAAVPATKPRSALRMIVPIAAALAAAVLAVLLVPPLLRPAIMDDPSETRLKGSPAGVYVVLKEQTVKAAAVGDKVSVVVSTGARPYAALFAVDQMGEVSRLWPKEGNMAGALKRPGVVTLAKDFEVTPGSATLYAAFSDEPVLLSVLQAELSGWLVTENTPTPATRSWAQTRLEVH